MGTPYQESYGDDRVVNGYFNDEEEEILWRSGFKTGQLWYDWREHMWKCRCRTYLESGACKHSYRTRHQNTVTVNEEYL